MKPKIQLFFSKLSSEKRVLASLVRDAVLATDKKIEEDIKWGALTFIYKGNMAFVYSYNQSDYINLGFHKAVELSDPKGLFEGSGKGMRHIKIYTKKDIPVKQMKAWIKEAMKLNEE